MKCVNDPYTRMSFIDDLLQQDSVTGLLLAGIGHINEQQKKNFLVVDTSVWRHFCYQTT
jgi:hypothetical protein